MNDDVLDTLNPAFEPCFFRDSVTFQVLQDKVLPALVAQGEQSEKTLRLWSAGCSLGEDAYSLAILIADLVGDALPSWTIRIFATNSDEGVLEFVKQGIYNQDSLHTLSEEQRTRWFKHSHQRYQISKVLRRMVIIGQHDIAQDIPFARMDLIMCGDVLFSCSHERQNELMRMFALSLAPRHGYLTFGKTENITLSALSFQSITETASVYQITSDALSRKVAVNDRAASLLKQLLHYKGLIPEGGVTAVPPLSLQEVLFRLSPNGIIVIDRAYRIVTANRSAHRFCSLPEEAHLLDFLHSIPGLPYASVRSAIDRAFCEGSTQNVPEVELTLTEGGNGRVLNMYICLLPAEVTTPDYVVIYIQEVTNQTIIKQAHHTMVEAFQNLQINYTTLNQKHTLLMQRNAQLQEASENILSLYEQLLVSFEECQAKKEALEQDQAALQEELETVCAALALNEIAS